MPDFSEFREDRIEIQKPINVDCTVTNIRLDEDDLIKMVEALCTEEGFDVPIKYEVEFCDYGVNVEVWIPKEKAEKS